MSERKIRVLVAKPGLDGHDRGAKVIARALRDAGMEVIYTGLRQTPEMIASAAAQEDVDVIGLFILSGAHNTICPQLMKLLREKGMDDGTVLVGGIIPEAAIAGRERIEKLIDPGSPLFELGLYAAFEMYEEWGGAPSAGTVTGLATVCGRKFMVIANDATVKAGAFFPMTAKKVIRAQNIAIENRIPTIYLVDSAGVFLPLQEDVFPDTDDFGRVFRNNAVMSAMGIPQITAIMGMCVAGGAYLPVMCDHILMTEGSGLFLAGPALVQAAIGPSLRSLRCGR